MTQQMEGKGANPGFTARPESVARLSIAAIGVLIAAKVAASVFTGSIGIRADAIHSSIDLLGAVVGLLAIRIARKPPDERHAFGHGKAEDIAGAVIAGLIFFAAGTIFYEAIRRLVEGGSVEFVSLGIYVTLAAIVINTTISWYALRVARSSESLALEATARDMQADVLSSCAVLIGLVLVRLTGNNMADPIVSLLVAALIARTAFLTVKKSIGGLMDTRLPQSEEQAIEKIIMEHAGQLAGFHELRTRKVGNQRHVYLHLVMPKNASVEEAHAVCDHLEQDIQKELPHASVEIHVEPCDGDCGACPASCDVPESDRR
jgi:cation diffusion facilitator family transporter